MSDRNLAPPLHTPSLELTPLFCSSAIVNIAQKLIPIGTLAIGLLFGSLWSPRAKEPTPEQIAQAASQFRSSKSSRYPAGSGNGSQSSATSSKGSSERDFNTSEEFNLETLVDLMSTLRDNDEHINPMALARYAAQISKLNEIEALALLQELKGPFDESYRPDTAEIAGFASIIVFSRLCELNGPEAMRLLASEELGKGMEDEFSTMGMNAWVAADPEGATAWFNNALMKVDTTLASGGDPEEIEDPDTVFLDSNTAAFESYINGMSLHDPEALKETISNYQSEELRENLMEEYSRQMAENAESKEEVLALLNDESLPTDSSNKIELIEKLSEYDLPSATSYVEDQPVSISRDNLLATVASEMLRKDPAKGAAWYQAQEISSDAGESLRLQTITGQWMHRDIEGAANWLLEQPNTPQRDTSESYLANQSARNGEWEAAFRWQSDISNPEARQNTRNQLLGQGWDRRNNTFKPEAYQAAQEAGLGEAADAYLERHGK